MAAKKTVARRSIAKAQKKPGASGKSVSSIEQQIEQQIFSFYRMDRKKAAQAVKDSGVLTTKGRLKAVYR